MPYEGRYKVSQINRKVLFWNRICIISGQNILRCKVNFHSTKNKIRDNTISRQMLFPKFLEDLSQDTLPLVINIKNISIKYNSNVNGMGGQTLVSLHIWTLFHIHHCVLMKMSTNKNYSV